MATHRHQDHVSGFEDQDVWADVEVGEVGSRGPRTPTTRTPGLESLDRQSKRRELLFGFVDGAQGREWEETKGIVDNNIGYKNAEAMATLHRGFAGRPTRYFLPEVPKDGTGTRTGSMTPDLLPGVKVHILGPLRSQEAIRDMNPPADDRFLRVGRPGKRTVEADGRSRCRSGRGPSSRTTTYRESRRRVASSSRRSRSTSSSLPRRPTPWRSPSASRRRSTAPA